MQIRIIRNKKKIIASISYIDSPLGRADKRLYLEIGLECQWHYSGPVATSETR